MGGEIPPTLKMKEQHIIWKTNQSAKDYLASKEYEHHKEQSLKKEELWKFKMEK